MEEPSLQCYDSLSDRWHWYDGLKTPILRECSGHFDAEYRLTHCLYGMLN